jgi:hypothetical protein
MDIDPELFKRAKEKAHAIYTAEREIWTLTAPFSLLPTKSDNDRFDTTTGNLIQSIRLDLYAGATIASRGSMDWDSEFSSMTTRLAPGVRHEIDLSFASFENLAPTALTTRVKTITPAGILGASPPLHKYCAAYVPNVKESYVNDIQKDLLAVGKQAMTLTGRKMQWPVARLGNKEIPVALYEKLVLGPDYADFSDLPQRVDAYVGRLQAAGIDVFMADPRLALHLFSDLLTPFLAVRLAATSLYPAVSLSPNVTVSNTQNGWNVVYRPELLLGVQKGLGGPGSPVKGYIRPGTYVFGIVKGGQPAQWDDQTSWDIPRQTTIHISLP